MSDVLLSLVMPDELARVVQDLLLAHDELSEGFTAEHAEGHGASVALTGSDELVAGHAPRTVIRLVGTEDKMRRVLDLLRAEMPGARVYFWMVPVLARGHL